MEGMGDRCGSPGGGIRFCGEGKGCEGPAHDVPPAIERGSGRPRAECGEAEQQAWPTTQPEACYMWCGHGKLA